MKTKIAVAILGVLAIACLAWAYNHDEITQPVQEEVQETVSEVATQTPQVGAQSQQACREEYEKSRINGKLLIFLPETKYGDFTFTKTNRGNLCYITHHFAGTATISGAYGRGTDGVTPFFVVSPESQDKLPKGQTGWWTSAGLEQLFSHAANEESGKATIVISSPILIEAFEEDGTTLNTFTVIEVRSNEPGQ